jgi:hypothetical protein
MISGIYKIENKINHCIYVGKAKDIQIDGVNINGQQRKIIKLIYIEL